MNKEANVRTLDMASFNRATRNRTTHPDSTVQALLNAERDPLYAGLFPIRGIASTSELNNLVQASGGTYRFPNLESNQVGFVTNDTRIVQFHSGCRVFRLKDDDRDGLIVSYPSAHAYQLEDGTQAALIYTEDNGALWVTQAVAGNECALYHRALYAMAQVRKQTSAVKGFGTAANTEWQAVTFPIFEGIRWSNLDWLRGAEVVNGGASRQVAAMAQCLNVEFHWDDPETCAPDAVADPANRLDFTGDVLVFKVGQNPTATPDKPLFRIEWLYALDGVAKVAA